ncbi:MAG: ChbG/HpnK family deacetylase [Allorhizobium sp.]
MSDGMPQTAGAVRERDYLLVADDYGISAGVGEGIRALISSGSIDGTGCMTLFAEWRAEAGKLLSTPRVDEAAIGLHLTLTDFPALNGHGLFSGTDRLPPLKRLILASYFGGIDEAAIHAELDAQLDAFVSALGRMPDYLDGHQHVHFLGPVRRWLVARRPRFAISGSVPWLRGSPLAGIAQGAAMRAKVLVVTALAGGFDASMRKAGYRVLGPLAGFYDWRAENGFPACLDHLEHNSRPGMVVMCHPGVIDAMLEARDPFVAARAVELRVLSQPGRMRSPTLQPRLGQGTKEVGRL